MAVEQRFVIKYWYDEGLTGVQIIQKLKDHYGKDALSNSEIYRWIREVKCGRTDLTNALPPGRPRIEDLAPQILRLLDDDPHASARQIAGALGVSPATVGNRLRCDLGMRCCHLRWVPHMLTSPQKAKRAELARSMLAELSTQEPHNFAFVYTGDESWMLYVYPHKTQWISNWDEPEEVERPSHHHRKIMLTVFFNGNGKFAMDLMEEGRTMNSEYFCETVLPGVAVAAYGEGRRPHARKAVVHFDNAPIHNTKNAKRKVASLGMRRMDHPPYSPDLAPCDFFLFGYIKGKLSGASFSTTDELANAIREVILGIPGDMILRVFQEWMARLQACCDCGGNYVE
jgi:histone-lysine N-methyltransferase SETMAR